jgi:Fe-S-cluster containining protein
MECMLCGGCCVAPDIAALDKPLGQRCPHLGEDYLCRIYETRPAVCRSYEPDELCERIAAPTLSERVDRYLAIFGLSDEAARIRASGATSMRAARHLPLIR